MDSNSFVTFYIVEFEEEAFFLYSKCRYLKRYDSIIMLYCMYMYIENNTCKGI